MSKGSINDASLNNSSSGQQCMTLNLKISKNSGAHPQRSLPPKALDGKSMFNFTNLPSGEMTYQDQQMSILELQKALQRQESEHDGNVLFENYIQPIFRIERVIRKPDSVHEESESQASMVISDEQE